MAPLLVTEVHFGGENNISVFLKSQPSDRLAHFKAAGAIFSRNRGIIFVCLHPENHNHMVVG